ncbi:hypothetical protein RDWZM_006660 [Blomia tropicalis]|uniref:DUF4590 domain-containing protein n=1 Tax=Blomia tropicalis TaxID=40697 RepID=A0A9Q0M6J0_BLOTA|nr:hypothetical protein RDWZM_006660 [Blomia tropicalis]
MWAIAAQHKRYNDALSGYNSLKDPHLNSYFRRPQMRRHLIKANIINKDNMIVEEISTTKQQQQRTRKQKKQLYNMLGEYVRNGSSASELIDNTMNYDNISSESTPTPTPSKISREELIHQAKFMFTDKTHSNNKQSSDTNSVLVRLDRMIRAMKEHDQLISNDRELWISKSCHDISSSSTTTTTNRNGPKSSTSTSSQLSRETRPKSSYGRHRSNPNLTNCEPMVKKSISFNGDQKDEEIVSITEDNSWSDSSESDLKPPLLTRFGFDSSNYQKYLNQNRTTYQRPLKSCNTTMSGRQSVRMSIRYNGLNGATNRGGKRNVKVLQQVSVGGNSILIYDGYVTAGEVFTFDIRPHPNNSFSIIILINGIRDLRLNACCEHKHRPGTNITHFTFVDIVGGRPCFICQSNVTSDMEHKYMDWFDETTKQIDTRKEVLPHTEQHIQFELDDDHEKVDNVVPVVPMSPIVKCPNVSDESMSFDEIHHENFDSIVMKEIGEYNDILSEETMPQIANIDSDSGESSCSAQTKLPLND